jgi:hypothetical protein
LTTGSAGSTGGNVRIGGGAGGGETAHAAKLPKISHAAPCRSTFRNEAVMLVLLLEALGALALLIFIVWWTMFSGRKGGERKEDGRD